MSKVGKSGVAKPHAVITVCIKSAFQWATGVTTVQKGLLLHDWNKMRCSDFATVVLFCVAIGIAGCNKVTAPQTEAVSPQPPSSAKVSETSAESSQGSSDFEDMFAAIVKGALQDPSEQDEQASWEALEKIAKFDKSQNEVFLEFLEGKLNDPSPFVRTEAGFNVALMRCDSGMGQKNAELIPLFVDLLKQDDIFLRKSAMIDMDPVVRSSNLGDKLQPLVPVLIEALKEPTTTYLAISYLGEMGPMSKEAIPAIRMAAERDNDKTINQASEEAIRKIEGDAP